MQKALDAFRKKLESEVMAIRGEIGIWSESAIECAVAYERHRLQCMEALNDGTLTLRQLASVHREMASAAAMKERYVNKVIMNAKKPNKTRLR